ncbi:MAG: extracellular solute-binding protein [Alphaproteobacteria bacterium]|nr:extracellular solute-binding protein [Alphaproteobacteria bacterium]
MRLFIPVLVALCLIMPAEAQESKGFALSMHGTSRYGATSKNLSYVNPDAPKGGEIKIAALGSFDTLNPFSIKGRAAEGLNLVTDRLMARVWDEPFTMVPLIAQSYSMPMDRSEITFHLDPRAKFQDGTPILADDVLFSFETLKNNGRPNMRRVYKLVATAEKLGARSVRFVLGPGHDRETALILAMMPVLSKKWWTERNFDSAVLTPPNTSGPYKIAQVEPGRRIVYQRDPDYWAKDLLANRGQYNFDRIVYESYRDDTVAFEAFKSGDLTFRREMEAAKWASAYDFPARVDGRVVAEALPHQRPERVKALIFNSRRPPFNDPRVREALSLSFDFTWANTNLFHGLAKPITSIFPNTELAARNKASTPLPVRENLRRADALLKEAGWLIKNGQRLKDGHALRFEILLTAPEDEKLALHFVRGLEKLGIKPIIRTLDAAGYLRRLQDYDFDMTLYFWTSTLSPGSEQTLYWGCAAAQEKGRFNYAGICDPAIDTAAHAIAQANTRKGLIAAARALDAKIMAGHYFIPLQYLGADYVAYWKPIARPAVTPVYGLVMESWWMDPHAQKEGD